MASSSIATQIEDYGKKMTGDYDGFTRNILGRALTILGGGQWGFSHKDVPSMMDVVLNYNSGDAQAARGHERNTDVVVALPVEKPDEEKKEKKPKEKKEKKQAEKKEKKEKKPRAKTGYNLFVADERPRIKKANPDDSTQELMKKVGAAWKALEEEKRAEWNESAKRSTE